MLPCPSKYFFGIDCPGCGMQRSFLSLIKGELKESLVYYPALIPLMAMVIFLYLHIKFKFKYGSRILLWMFYVNIAIITINYVIRITR